MAKKADETRTRANYLDRAIAAIAPRWQLKRQRARIAMDLLERHYYDAAGTSRRTEGWPRGTGDANATFGAGLSRLRELARDLERNNPYAIGGILDTIETDAVGWGIIPTEDHAAFKAWSESTACDADGRQNLAGLTKTVMRTIPRDGEILVRRRWRPLTDGLPLPLQIQLLEPDYLDTAKEASFEDGGRIVQGVEFDRLGRRSAYWLFREHPGSTRPVLGRGQVNGSQRVPASEILHIFKSGRAGGVRGPSWFASALAKFRTYDEFDDATLMTQRIAACLSVVYTDVDGSSLGTVSETDPTTERLGPGMILRGAPGRDVKVVQPPRMGDFEPYSRTQLRGIGRPFGVTYEAMTGDYSNVNFSSARMGRIGYQPKVDDWRERILIVQFLNPVWAWAMEGALVMGLPVVPTTEWTSPALPMLEPDKEGKAHRDNVRAGAETISEMIRSLGYNPKRFLRELADDFKRLDELELILDCDPRKTTQQGIMQMSTKPPEPKDPNAAPAPAPAAPPDEEDDEQAPTPKADDEDDEEDEDDQADDSEDDE